MPEPVAALPPSPDVFIVAGEPSGDQHAAHLLRALRDRCPGLRARGFGGTRLAAAGMELRRDLAADAVMGLFPVLAALPRLRAWFREALDEFDREPPDAVILVDYPGFNLRLARAAKRRGLRVIYYISPQVWAWNRRRVKLIAAVVDLMVVILPFEEAFYRGSGVPVFYSGHPLVDHLATIEPDEVLTAELGAAAKPLIGVFPGSRRHVAKSLAPGFLRALELLRARPGFENATVVVAAADTAIEAAIRKLPVAQRLPLRFATGRPYEVMRAADLCLTSSGTTTIEIAAHEKPFVLAYRVSPLLWLLGRLLVRVPYIGLVNLVAERGVVPEIIGVRARPEAIADALEPLWNDRERRRQMIEDLGAVRARLAEPGSYDRAAERIAAELEPSPRDH